MVRCHRLPIPIIMTLKKQGKATTRMAKVSTGGRRKSKGDVPDKLYRAKELSWLSFNERVLQEAANPDVPLLERLRFLGIFSSNLDEFFRVRVATLQRLLQLNRNTASFIDADPERTLAEIQDIVVRQHKRFDSIYQDLTAELARQNVFILNEQSLDDEHAEYVREYFRRTVRPQLIPLMIDQIATFPELRDDSTYLAVVMAKSSGARKKYALLEIPETTGPRFVVLPPRGENRYVILLDDVIRFCLDQVFAVFSFKRFKAYAIKLTRDAKLDLGDDMTQSYVKKVMKSLKRRRIGDPVRFIYDADLPGGLVKTLVEKLGIEKHDTMVPGARYHNFRDFWNFPDLGLKEGRYPEMPVLQHNGIKRTRRLLETIDSKDILLHYPYQSFDYVIDMLREASIDPKVSSIRTTIYRAGKKSSVINALVNAARNGKSVTAVLELQARFDEEANLSWGNMLQDEGVKVIYGVPGLKVHSKLCLVTRRSGNSKTRYAIVGTGNFNEDTARQYTDHSLFTADPRITGECHKVFRFYNNNLDVPHFKHLLVSPFNMRQSLVRMIRKETRLARAGKSASIYLKLNNLVDREIIRGLYEAGAAGVDVRLIVRSMFSLITGVDGVSDNIDAISIVDRFLEHTRFFIFGNEGAPRYFISSADLMYRNLDERVEVTCPIYDPALQEELKTYFDIQWRDNVKARLLDKSLNNKLKSDSAGRTVRSQWEIGEYLKKLHG